MADADEIQPPTDADLLEKARISLAKSMETLEICLERVRKQLATEQGYDAKLGSHLAWVTSHMAGVTNALRQLEKHDRHMARTPEQRHELVLAYLQQLDPIRRADVRAKLDQLDQKRSILS
jgi:aspartokinase